MNSGSGDDDDAHDDDGNADEFLRGECLTEQPPRGKGGHHIAERQHGIGDGDLHARERQDPHRHGDRVERQPQQNLPLQGEVQPGVPDIARGEAEAPHGFGPRFDEQLRRRVEQHAGEHQAKGDRAHRWAPASACGETSDGPAFQSAGSSAAAAWAAAA